MTYHQQDDERANWYRNKGHHEASENIRAAAQEHSRPNGQYSIRFDSPQQSSFQPFQPQPGAVPTPQASSEPSTYRAGEGTQALADFKSACEGMWLGWVAYKAGTNYHKMHPDGVDAAIYGAHALRRWWVWLIFVKIWLVWLGIVTWLTYLTVHDIRGESYVDHTGGLLVALQRLGYIGLPITFVLGIAVPYCRNVDYSLFKRRLMYRLFRPLVVALDRIPNGLLYLTIPVGLFFPGNLLHDQKPNDNPYNAPVVIDQAAIEQETERAVEEVCSIINDARENGTPDANSTISLKIAIRHDLVEKANVDTDLKTWYLANC